VLPETPEAIPVIVDGVDPRIVGTSELALELEVVGRIGEDEIDAAFRQSLHHLDAIALDDAIERRLKSRFGIHVPPALSTWAGRLIRRSPQVKSLVESKR